MSGLTPAINNPHCYLMRHTVMLAPFCRQGHRGSRSRAHTVRKYTNQCIRNTEAFMPSPALPVKCALTVGYVWERLHRVRGDPGCALAQAQAQAVPQT